MQFATSLSRTARTSPVFVLPLLLLILSLTGATVLPAATVAQTAVARLNAGGDAITLDGTAWSADQFVTGGDSYSNPSVTSIAGTTSDALYLTEHSGAAPYFDYAIPVPEAGTYTVRLHFAEIYWGAPVGGSVGSDGPGGERVFSVSLEGGATELADYDINADVGPMTAVVKSFEVPVSDGTLDIAFTATEDQPKISAIEVLSAAEASPPDLSLTNLDGVPFADRLVFHRHENDPDNQDPVVHDEATLRLSNAGTEALDVSGLQISGPFQLVSPPSLPVSLGLGEQLDVPVQFTGTGGGSNELLEGTLTIASNDPDTPSRVVELAGLWQSRPEGGQEPNVAEIMDAFGYGTSIRFDGQEINNDGRIEMIGEEVLSPYWQRANTDAPVTVRQLAAFHSCCNKTATVFWHAEGSGSTNTILTHKGTDAQTLLPRLNGSETQPALGTFAPSSATFGFKIDPEWSDPTNNDASPDDCSAGPETCGHHVRFWPVRDQAGAYVPGTFLMVMDYSGINYDFNDNVYLVTNVEPAENTPPKVAQGIDNQSIVADDDPTTVDLTGAFIDYEDETLSLGVQSIADPSLVSASISGSQLSLSSTATAGGTTTSTVRATDSGGAFAEDGFSIGVSNASATACGTYSTLDCADVPVSLPYTLSFDGGADGLADGSGTGTGFTVAVPPSARLAADGAPTFANVPGYEPGLLSVENDALTIATTKGIMYKEPGESSETNSQINALGAGIPTPITSAVTIETTLGALPNPAEDGFQQAGPWFGLSEASYVKLVALHTGGGDYKVQVGYEYQDAYDNAGSPPAAERNTADGVIPGGSSVTLRLTLDPAAGTAVGEYSTDGGQTFQQVEPGRAPIAINAALFGGTALESGLDPMSFAGVHATHRRASTSIDFAFQNLSVDAATPPSDDFTSFQALVNFQDEATTPPSGYLKDFGEPFGARTGTDQGGGTYNYGWVDPQTGDPANLVEAGRNRTSTGLGDPLKATLIHMDYPVGGDFPDGRYPRGNWEIAVPEAGAYQVVVTVGEAQPGADPEEHRINAEGTPLIPGFVPEGTAGDLRRHATGSGVVQVTDGRLTLSYNGGGENTKLNAVRVTRVADDRPFITNPDPVPGATNVFLDESLTTGIGVPTVGDGTDTGTVNSSTVLLYPTGAPGSPVSANVNDTGGGDAIVVTPAQPLQSNAQYTLEVTDGVKGVITGNAFVPFEMTFNTGTELNDDGPGDDITTLVEFEQLDSGGSNEQYTSLTFGPDDRLYGITIDGRVKRWDVVRTDDPATPDDERGTLVNEETITTVTGPGGETRLAIGLAFDPAATANNLVAWVSHNTFGFSGMANWGGQISRLSGPDLGTQELYVDNLPRSARDHLTNSIEFGPDGAMYVNVGSMSAMGAPDNAWGDRAEVKLSAAVIRVDVPALEAAGVPFDAQTSDGGSYDPYAATAPIKLFATGTRNAYDLLWHSNGNLYVPTNGSAAGGNAPASVQGTVRPDGTPYDGPDVPALTNISKRSDYLYRVPMPMQNTTGEIVGTDGWSWNHNYYGHPNPSRGEFVLNGGDPTDGDGNDPADVPEYPAGTQPDDDYFGFAYDFGENKSPNGVIEFESDVFGGALTGKIMVARFSAGDDLIILLAPNSTNGDIAEAYTGVTGLGGFDDPLDLAEDPITGALYVAEHDRDGSSTAKLTLLRPVGISGDVPALATSDDELIFSGPQNETRQQTLTVTNNGTASLDITGASFSGANAGLFNVTPATATVGAGQSASFDVTFAPSGQTGALEATLSLQSNAGTETVGVYGLSAAGYYGGNEPTLANVVQALGYDIDVGWTNLAGGTEAVAKGDEVLEPLFEKAGADPVTMTPVARYSPAEALPFGWYTPNGTTPALNEVGTLGSGAADQGNPEDQTLFPPVASGGTTFDPGSATFGFYTESNVFNHVRYTEDDLNSIPHAARIYPLKDRQGRIIPNTYLVGFEDASNGDYQDYVFAVSGIQPAGTTPPVAETRINVGGEALSTSLGDFGADDTGVLTGSSEVSSKDFDVSGTDDDALYLNYRYALNPDNQGGGEDFGFALPVENGTYAVTLHFLEPYFGVTGPDGTGNRVFSVDVENGQGTLTDFDLTAEAGPQVPVVRTFDPVSVTDGEMTVSFTSSVNNAIISAIEVVPVDVPPVADACPPLSTLDCASVPVSLPYALTFDGGEGGLTDGSDVETGFTMVDPPSARLSSDGTPTFANAPGYEPSQLSVSGGQLLITSTPGIQYAQNSGTGTTSSDVNSLINGMGVGTSIAAPTTIETTIDGLDFSVTDGTNAEQAGLWFGLGEDNYVKLVVSKNGTDSGSLELAVEDKPTGGELTFNTSNDLGAAPTVGTLSSSAVTLRMTLDPAAGEVSATYVVDGGTAQDVATLPVPARFFAGLDHDADTATAPVSFAGVFTSQRRASTSIVAAFDGFSVTPEQSGIGPIAVDVTSGWNLVGLPLAVADASPGAVFPSAEAGTLFGFDGTYTTPDALVPGTGYWLRFAQDGTESVSGTENTTASVALVDGWNLVAGPSCEVPLSSASDPSGVLVPGSLFGFAGAYTTPDALTPGKGYWLQASAAGTVTFDCSAGPALATNAKSKAAAPNTPPTALTVADADGRRQTLYVGDAPEGRSYALPPTPPSGAFDARFDGDTRLLSKKEGLLRLQGDRYPLTVTLTDVAEGDGGERPGLIVDALDGTRVVATHELESASESFTVRDAAVKTLRVRTRAPLPTTFALHGNYPNPFVQRTTVAFDLPEDADVQLEVYDLLGRRVANIPALRHPAGPQRTIALDASRLSTGAYFYRIHAEMASGSITKTGRMTLVK